ncbi:MULTISPECIES: formate dehydrogenase subunit delta [Modicisalibacter]|uniref:formate dehydrogenase subunit delta n=1 Tax=Modicisalibacter TaxID=574347 RepID=UPI00100A2A60|nr:MULTISPECIES: formate dehydrogenase subunit delta [Halomonadaceae]MBZ9560055.1 formate dehydrogenase subunit delta [Modicisalibacter sp. R2A 31.J]MBZ9575964.1 formate dehydrogenase subunit delta [Modicisalibacter sp. MOD 31.J]
MSDQQLSQLVKMVNQIAANQHGDPSTAAQRVTSHLQKFWARSMKAQIIDYLDSDGSQLSPVAREAVADLKRLRQAS